MKINVSKNEFNKLLHDLKKDRENFTLINSSNKGTLIHEGINYSYFPNKVNSNLLRQMYFIKKVKDHVINNGVTYQFKNKIFYNQLSAGMKAGIWYKKEVNEIDLKAAYWLFAYKNGFISEEIYKEGLNIDKRVRLMALGALAKKQFVFNFKNGEMAGNEVIKSEETEGIFFKCAYDTDIIMKNLIKLIPERDFLFYWVDAVFFRCNSNVKEITEFLSDNEINFKHLEMKKTIKKAEFIEVIDFEDKKRIFNFKKSTNLKNASL